MTEPKWHGWATPEQVLDMMEDMFNWIAKNHIEIDYQPLIDYMEHRIALKEAINDYLNNEERFNAPL